MKNSFGIVLLGGVGLVLAACSTATDGGGPTESLSKNVALVAGSGDSFPVIRFKPEVASQATVAESLAKIAGAMGHPVKSSDVQLRDSLTIAGKDGDNLRMDMAVDASASLLGRYESADDSFEVFEAAAPAMKPEPSDIDETRARAIFESTLRSLQASGVVSPERSKASDVTTRAFYAAEGNQDGAKRKWVNEYVFFVPTKINGVGVGIFSREYGLWINVHRSGRVRRIELSGTSATAPDGSTISVVRSVARAATPPPSVENATKAAFKDSTTEPLGLRLVLENVPSSGEVAPRELFRVVPLNTASDGTQFRSKAFVASYPLADDGAEITISPTPGSHGSDPGAEKPQ
jgi:hypothetical protein